MCLHNFIKITVKNFHVCPHTPRGKSPEKTPPWEPKTRTRNASNSNVDFPKTTPTLPWPLISPAQLSIGILQVSKIFQAWKWLSTHPYTQLPLPNWHKLLQGLWLTLCVCMCACVKLIFIIGFCDLVIIIVFLSIQPVEFSSLSMWHLIAQKTLKMSQKKRTKQVRTLWSSASTIRYPLLKQRICQRDEDMHAESKLNFKFPKKKPLWCLYRWLDRHTSYWI